LFISSLVQTQQQAFLGAFAVLLPFTLLSGFADAGGKHALVAAVRRGPAWQSDRSLADRASRPSLSAAVTRSACETARHDAPGYAALRRKKQHEPVTVNSAIRAACRAAAPGKQMRRLSETGLGQSRQHVRQRIDP